MSSKSKNRLDKFGFSHDNPELFRVSQWGDLRTMSKWYLCYRIFLAMAYTSIYSAFWILDSSEHRSKRLIYLTEQSMLLLVIQLLLQMFLAINTHRRQNQGDHLRYKTILEKGCQSFFTYFKHKFKTVSFLWLDPCTPLPLCIICCFLGFPLP